MSCLAQQYPFVHYTPKDGLVNSRVRKAYQDSKGRIYFITYGGLSVYDGARFRNYTTQNGLITQLVNDVIEVGEDSLLVAINNCGLNVLVRGQMKTIDMKDQLCPVMNNFFKSIDGNIYVTADDGLYRLTGRKLVKLSTAIKGSSDPVIYLGAITEHRNFLVFTTNDLRKNSGLFLYDKSKDLIIDILPDEHVYSLKTDRDSLIWLSSSTSIKNLDTVALNQGRLVLKDPYPSYLKGFTLSAGSIVFNRMNELMIASGNKGITHYRKDGSYEHFIVPEQSGFYIQNFFVDRENIIWLCHDGNGVYKLPDTRLKAAASYMDPAFSGIRSTRSKSPDTCWALTYNGKLILHTSRGIKKWDIRSPSTLGSIYYNGKDLYGIDERNLFIAPIPQSDLGTITFRRIFSLPDTSGFGSRFIDDPYGNTILFESRNICVFQKDKLLFTYPLMIYDLVEGFYIDRQQQLWVMTRGFGLRIFSIHPGDPSHYLQKKKQFTKEFVKPSPRCMIVDRNDILWVGTRNNGLMGFEFNNEQLIQRYHFHTGNGTTDNFVTSLAIDKDNNILAGTQTGLDRLIKTNDGNYRIENITKINNIFSYITELWTDAGNNSYALTNTGAVMQLAPVLPGHIIAEPHLLMEEIKVNGKLLTEWRSALRLRHDQRNLTFSLAAPSYIDEKQVKYSYLLSGSGNKEWSDTSSAADITLLNLAPGDYTLHVKAIFLSTS